MSSPHRHQTPISRSLALGVLALIVACAPACSDDDKVRRTATVQITERSVVLGEPDRHGYLVLAVGTEPREPVTISLSSASPELVVPEPASVTVSPIDWQTGRRVDLLLKDDDVFDGARTVAITASITSGPKDYVALAPLVVEVSVADDDAAGLDIGPPSGTTTERRGQASFELRLTSRPRARVVIPVASEDSTEGVTDVTEIAFDETDWDVTKVVVVTGQDDDLADGPQPFVVALGPAQSDDRGYAGKTGRVTLQNTDDESAGIVVSKVSGRSDEAGGQASFNVSLASQPRADVRLSVTSSDAGEGAPEAELLQFTAVDWSASKILYVTGVDDDVDDGAQLYDVVLAVDSTEDEDYRVVVPVHLSVFNDDDDVAGVTLSAASGATSEAGEAATFTVALDTEPTAPVKLTLTSTDPGEGVPSPSQITIPVETWREPRLVTVTGVDDDLDDGPQDYAIEVAEIDSPDPIYTALLVDSVALVNEDDEGAGVIVGPVVGTATESGAQATFTVVLASQPSTAVTIPVSSADPGEVAVTPISLVFTPLDWNAPQQVIATGQDDDEADGATEVPIHLGPIVGNDTTGYAGRHIPSVLVANIDNDSAGVLTGPVTGTATESGGRATFTVMLASRPTGDVTIPIGSGDPGELTVSPASLLFTPQNWAAPRTITVTGVDDATADGAQSVAITLGPLHAPTENTGYHGHEVPPVTVVNADDDTAGVLVSDLTGTITEAGGAATFTIVLASRPTGNVTIPLGSSRDKEATVSPAQLVFTGTNWSSPQTVTVKGVDDALPDGNQPFQIRIGPVVGTADPSYQGLTIPSIPALNLDDDSAGVLVSAVTGQATEAGGAAAFTVTLRSQPTAEVTLPIASRDPTQATVAPAALVFTATNWNAPQTVRVTGVDDAHADGAQLVAIRMGPTTSGDAGYHGLAIPDVTLGVLDNDTAGIVVSGASGSTTEAGGQASFTVALASRPTANVVLALASSLPTEGTVAPAALVFTTTNWSSPQAVTVTGQDDALADGDRPFEVRVGPASSPDAAYAGMAVPSVPLINVDNDTVGVIVSAVAGAASENGDAATFSVSLRTRPSGVVTLPINATSNGDEVRISPAFLAFGPDGWAAPQVVTVSGRDDDLADGDQVVTIALGPIDSTDTAYASATITPSELQVHNVDNDTAGILVTNFQGQPTEAGGQATVSIALRTRPAADVTITPSSSDPSEASVAPASLVFTADNWASPRLVIATGVDDDTADGHQPFEVRFTVASADSAYGSAVIAPVAMTTLDDDSAGVSVGPVQGTATESGGQAVFALSLRSAPTHDVAIALSTPHGAELALPATPVVFTPLNWAAPQFVYARGVDDALSDGNQIARVDFAVTSTDARYDDLAVASTFVVNVDDDSAGLVVGDVDGQPTERGGSATFAIRLTSRPASAVTVPLASTSPSEGAVSPASLVIQPDQWSTPHLVTVTGVDDNPPIADGARAFRVTIGPSTSSDAAFAGLGAPSVALTNLDDDSPGVEVGAVVGHTLEGDPNTKATFTVRLTSQPTANVTLAVVSLTPTEGTASPASLQFTPQDWNAAKTITATGAEDPVADGDRPFAVALGPVVSSDLGYDRMVLPDVIIINHDNDSAGVSVGALTGQPSEAGGAATFEVRLDTRPTANVVIPIASSDAGEIAVSPATLTFTPTNWQGLQAVTVTGVDDAIADALQAAQVVLGPVVSVDPGYAGMAIAPVAVTNQDDDTAGIVASELNQDVTESGGRATLSIALTTEPSATVEVPIAITSGADEADVNPARLVFTPLNWNAPQLVTVTGLDDAIKDGDQDVTLAFGPAASGDAAYDGLAVLPATRTFKNLDNDAAGLIVSDFQGSPSESGGQATFWVVLRSQPTAAVTVALASSDASEAAVSPASLVFAAGNWSTPQLVTVTGVDDPEVDGHRAFGVTFDLSSSSDPAYKLVTHAALSLVNRDDDTAAVSVSAAVGHCTEAGGHASFMVSLTTRPVGTVTIPVTVSDLTEASLSPTPGLGAIELVFTAADWLAKEVKVYGVDDALVDGDQYLLANLGPVAAPNDPPYDGVTLLPVPLDNRDDDAAAIVVSAASGQPDEDGGAATFTVVLTSSPSSLVTVPVISSDVSEGVPSPTSLTFDASNWNVARTVTVTGQEDAIADGAVPFIVRLGPTSSGDLRYHGLQPPEVRLTNLDDGDAVGITTVGDDLAVAETGTTKTFTVKLDSQPIANVVVPITSSDLGEASVSPAQLVFTPTSWGAAQTVTVRGVDDALVDGAQSVGVMVGPAVSSDPFYAGVAAAAAISVTNADDDTGALVASVIGQASESGGTAYLTVRLSAAPSDVVNVAIASGDVGELAVAPPLVTFTATNWQNAQHVELRGVDDNEADGDQSTSVSLTATSGDGAFNGKTASVSATTADDDIAAVIVGDIVGQPTEAGGVATLAIQLATRPAQGVTVAAASASAEVSVGPAVTFTPADWSSPRLITIAAVDDARDDGDKIATVSFQVTSGDGSYDAFALPAIDVQAIDDDTRGVIVGAASGQPSEFGAAATFTVRLATEPTAPVTVALSSTDTGEGTVTASLSFDATSWMTPKLVTVTGADDGLQDGTQSYAITFAVTGGDYAGLAVPSVPMTTTDNDSGAGVSVRVISGAPSEGGGTAVIGVRLDSQPASAVSVAITSSATGEGTVSASTLAFDAQSWSQERTVIVTGVDDAYDDGDASFEVAFDPSGDPAYAALATFVLPLVNADDDQAGFTVSQVSGQPTEAGGAATFTVAPTTRPIADEPITVNVLSSDASEGAANSPLVFTNTDWAAKTVTVTGQDDALDDGDQPFSVHLGPAISADSAYSGRTIPSVPVVNRDDDNAGVDVTVTGGKTSELGASGPTVSVLVKLTSRPDFPVTIPVAVSDPSEAVASAASLVFPADTGTWASGITVTITGNNDDIADGNVPYQVLLGPAVSNDGLYAGRVIAPIALVNDDQGDTVGVTVSKASVSTSEGGAADTFTVVLTSAPTANVTIPVASSDPSEASVSPAALEFTPANWNVARTVTVSGVDDDIVDGDVGYHVALGPVSSADPGYGGLLIAAVTGTNTDQGDTRGLEIGTLSGELTEAGGSATLTVALTSEPTSNVTVAASITTGADEASVSPASLVFTAGNWNQPQLVRLTGRDDLIVDGPQDVVLSLDPSGGDYGGVATATVSTTNADDDHAAVLVSDVIGSPTEAGGVATFRVHLGSQPSASVTFAVTDTDSDDSEVIVSPPTLTFTTDNWMTPQTVAITGKDDLATDGDQVVTVSLSITSGAYPGAAMPSVVVSNRDDDQAGVSVRLVSGPTTEAGGTAQLKVRLNTAPASDVVIGTASSDASEGTVSAASLTFTSANWSSEQTLTVTGVNDAVADGDQSYLVTFAISSGPPAYTGLSIPSVPLVNRDDDVVGFTVAVSDGQTHETDAGDKGTVSVVLRSEPSAPVTLSFAVSDPSEASAAGTSLTFTTSNWNTAQTITLTGVDDSMVDGNVAYQLVFTGVSSADLGYADLSIAPASLVNVDAGDVVGLVVSQTTTDLQTSESGDSASFQVKLQSQPSAPVTVPVASLDGTEGVASPAVLVFTPSNWGVNQTVTVTGQNDPADDGDAAYQVRFGPTTSADAAYAGLTDTRTLTNVDDDTRGLVLGATVGGLSEGGGQATITVALATEPSDTVTVTVSADQADEVGLAPAVLTFTAANWNQPQTLTATGKDDAEADGDQAVTLTFTAAGGDYASVGATRNGLSNLDDDVVGVRVGDVQGQLTEGGGLATFTLALTSQPTHDVEITVTVSGEASDQGAATRTFTPASWATPQTVVLKGADDLVDDGDKTVTVSFTVTSSDAAYHDKPPAGLSLTNRDDDTRALLVSPVSGQPTEHGGAATFTVRLATQPTADVTVSLSSTDDTEGTVTSPLTFTAGDSGNWAIPQTVTVTGQDDGVADGDQTFAIRFALAGGDYANLAAADVLMTNRDNDAGVGISARLVSSAVTEAGGAATLAVRLNSQPVSNVSIAIASSNTAEGQVTSTTPLTFTGANWASEQTVIVAGQPDDVDDGDVAFNVTFDPSGSADLAYKLVPIATIPLVNVDDDTAGVLVSKAALTTTEGATTDTFTVSLTSQPTHDVTIAIASSDTGEATVAPASLTFTPDDWDAETVTVTGVNDDVDDGDQIALLNLGPASSSDAKYQGLSIPSVAVVNGDDDTAGITVTTSGTTTSEAGGTATITIKLATRPTSVVVIPVVVSDPSEASASTSAVSIPPTGTTWQDGVTVTITGMNDAVADGAVAYQVLLGPAASTDPSYAGTSLGPIAMTNTDDGDATGLVVSKSAVTTSESGTSDTFTVKLASEPTGTVQVAVSSSDTSEVSVSPATLTFTPADWSITRTVTATGVDDAMDDGDQSATITLDPTGANYDAVASATVAASNADDDAVGITLGPVQGALSEEGGIASFTIVLDSQPIGTGNVQIGVAVSPEDEATVLTPTFVFTAANWNVPQLVQIEGDDDLVVDDAQDVTVSFTVSATNTDYTGQSIADVALSNADDDAAGLIVANVQGQPTETGGQATFTVRLASEPTGSVTVEVGVSKPHEAEVAPTAITFVASSPTGGQVLWNDPTTITVTGEDDGVADGNQVFDVTLDPSNAGTTDPRYTALSNTNVPMVNLDDDSAGVTVVLVSGTPTEEAGQALFRVTLNTPPSADVEIPIELTDGTEGCLLQGALTACPDDVVTTGLLTFTPANWSMPQTFIVEGVNDFLADGNTPFDVVLGPADSADLFYGGLIIPPVTVTNVEDDDAIAIFVNASTLATDESCELEDVTCDNGTSFTVVLGSEPSADVHLDLNPVNLLPALNDVVTGRDWSELKLTTPSGDCLRDGTDAPHSGDDPALTGCRLTFTGGPSGNWANPQTVTITGLNDDYDDDLQSLSLILGNFATRRPTTDDTTGYRFVTLAPLPVTVADNDDASITYAVIDAYAFEGDASEATYDGDAQTSGQAELQLTLSTRPTSPLTLTLAAEYAHQESLGTPVLQLPVTTIVIPDAPGWQTHTFSVNAIEDCYDDVVDGNTDNAATIGYEASQGGWKQEYDEDAETTLITTVDDDTAAVTVARLIEPNPLCDASGADTCGFASEQGGTFQVRVTLATTPVAPTTFDLQDGGTFAQADSLTFTSESATDDAFAPGEDSCSWTGTMTVTGLDEPDEGASKVRTLHVVPADVPDEQPPRIVNDAPLGFGPDSWQGPESNPNYVPGSSDPAKRGAKSNWHARYVADGNGLAALFPSKAEGLKLGDIESISYWTKRPDGDLAGKDWWLQIYTRPNYDGTSPTWHHRRFISNYGDHAAGDGAWQHFTTDAEAIKFRCQLRCSDTSTHKTLANLEGQSELIEMISVQTDSGWNGFVGQIDGLEIKLKTGEIGRVDFGSKPYAQPLTTVAITSPASTPDSRYTDLSNSQSINVANLDNDVAISIKPGQTALAESDPADCTPLRINSRTLPFDTSTQQSAEVTVTLTSSDADYGGRFRVGGPNGTFSDTATWTLNATTWDDSATNIEVCARDDKRDEPNGTDVLGRFSVTAEVTATTDDTGYVVGLASGPSVFTVTDNDTVGVLVNGVLSPTLGTLAEGAAQSLTVRLASEPTDDVKIAVTAANPNRGIQVSLDNSVNSVWKSVLEDSEALTFTSADWNSDKTIYVRAIDDDIHEPTTPTNFNDFDLTFAIADGDTTGYATLPAKVLTQPTTSNEGTPAITLTAEKLTPTEAAGDDHCVDVTVTASTRPWKLDNEPASDGPAVVVVDLSATESLVGYGGTVTGTATIGDAFDAPLSAMLTDAACATNDARVDTTTFSVTGTVNDGNDATTDTTGYAGASPSITFSPVDDDVVGIVVNDVLAPTLAALNEGASQPLTVRLDSEPDDGVTVRVTAANPNRGILVSLTGDDGTWKSVLEDTDALTFTSVTWSGNTTIHVRAIQDDIYEPTGFNDFDLTFTVVDGDTTGYAALQDKVLTQPTSSDEASPTITLTASSLAPTEAAGVDNCVDVTVTASSRPWTLDTVPGNDQPASLTVDLGATETLAGFGGTVTGTAIFDGTSSLTSTVIDAACATDDERAEPTANTFDATGTIAAGSSDNTGLASVSIAAVTFTPADDDVAGFTLAPTTAEVTEGAAAPTEITLTLDSQPSTELVIALTLTQESAAAEGTPVLSIDCNGAPGCSGTTFTIPANDPDWDDARTFRVVAAQDCFDDPSDTDNGAELTAEVTSLGNEFDSVADQVASLTIVDDTADVAGISIAPPSGWTSEQAGTFSAQVTLATTPVGDTTFTPAELNGFTASVLTYTSSTSDTDSFTSNNECGLTAVLTFTGADNAPPRIQAVPEDVPDETRPRIASDFPEGFGPDSWQGPHDMSANAKALDQQKVNWHARWVTNGNALKALLGDEAEGLTINDLAAIRYRTARGDNPTPDRDWWVQIYVRPKHDGNDHRTWFRHRFINNYGDHTNTGWATHATDDEQSPMTFRYQGSDNQPTGSAMTLAQLKATYGSDAIEMISVQTDKGAPFDGKMDGLEIELTSGTKGVVDFGASRDIARTVTLDAASAADAVYDAASATVTVTNLDNEAALSLGALYTQLYEAGDDVPAYGNDNPRCTPLAVTSRTRPFATSTQSAAAIVVALTTSDLDYGGGFLVDNAIVASTTVTLGDGNWNNLTNPTGTNLVTVCVTDDTRDEDDGRTHVGGNRFGITATVLATGTTDETGYVAGLSSGALELSVVDDDSAAIAMSASGSTTESGGTATVSVTLDTEPTQGVTVTIVSADAGEVGGGSIVFPGSCAGWPCTLETNIAGVDDTYVDGAQVVGLTTTASSSDPKYDSKYATANVTNNDNDVVGLTLTVTNPAEGECASATVKASSQPYTLDPDGEGAGQLVVQFSSSDEDFGGYAQVTHVVLDESNWEDGATFQVCGASDDRDDGGQWFTLTATAVDGVGNDTTTDETGYLGLPAATTSAVVTPTDDPADVRGIIATPTSLITGEDGTSDTFTVKLATQPWGGSVTVTLALGDDTEGILSDTTLTFTDSTWNSAQTVTVTGIDDAPPTAGDDVTYTIALTATGGDYATDPAPSTSVSVTNGDGNPGNAVRDGDEDCDGPDLDGKDCADFDHAHGTLACSSEQAFELSGCWKAAQVAVGGEHLCVLKDDGAVECWSDVDNDPVLDVPELDFTQIAAGERHACGLSSGEVRCWGNLDYDSDAQTTQQAPTGNNFVEVVAGARHNCARRADKTVACWGFNGSGQTTVPVTPVTNEPRLFERLSAGTALSCGVRADNHAMVQCWGEANQSGQHVLASGFFEFGVNALASGDVHSCAIKDDGTLHCWGLPPNNTPVGDFVEVSAGGEHGCAIDVSDEIACWGVDTDGVVSGAPNVPGWSGLSSLADRTCAIYLVSSFGEVDCWGDISLPTFD